MRIFFIQIIILLACVCNVSAQLSLTQNWQFRQPGAKTWHEAIVPGTVYTDLQKNKLIPDPFFGSNELLVKWVDSVTWEYKTNFELDKEYLSQKQIDLVFDGLDTYADVYLNGKQILEANNMFRRYVVPVKPVLKKNNQLLILFHPAIIIADELAQGLPYRLPDNNRVFVRKSAFQFGWDWGPALAGCGIWQPIWLDGYNDKSTRQKVQEKKDSVYALRSSVVKLVKNKDSLGESFYFTVKGKPVFMKGANHIPGNIFLPSVTKDDYRKIIKNTLDANMNMLRVWGGGIYESDEFYDLCDSAGIYVWQDFMFAGSMYPGSKSFFANVKAEVEYQVKRLRHHPGIVLWCGNNEIDEAWHHWGWQQQFNLHNNDAAIIWKNYTSLFHDSLRIWLNEWDSTRPYIASSPEFGWGNPKSYQAGDSHYWGLWWGLQPWENFNEKTGRFVSEYGMQAMPGAVLVKTYTSDTSRYLYSPAIKHHQKAGEGFEKLNHYLLYYFIDSLQLANLSLDDYIYLTNCLQYYVLKNSIIIHRNKMPLNMGSLIWQMNDCWPATSWSLVDFSGKAKGGWYAAKAAFADSADLTTDKIFPKNLKLRDPGITIEAKANNIFTIKAFADAYFITLDYPGNLLNLPNNYFNLKEGEEKIIHIPGDVISYQITARSLFNVLGEK